MKKTSILIILLFALVAFGGKAISKTSSKLTDIEQSLNQYFDEEKLVYPVMQNSKTGALCCGNTQYSECIYPECPPPA